MNLRRLGASLQRTKTLKFQAGIPLSREEVVRMNPEAFEAWVLDQVRLLQPLYRAGAIPCHDSLSMP